VSALTALLFENMNKYTYKTPAQEEAQTVEVTVPSGNVFLFQKPSKYSMVFDMKTLPVALTEKAMEAWNGKGIGNVEAAFDQADPKDQSSMISYGLKIRDRVLELSREPKITLFPTDKDGEICVDDISDTDLDYLFQWVASGGNAAAQVADFHAGAESDALASASRSTKRPKAVQAGGAQ
jgi:hypothetical protein